MTDSSPILHLVDSIEYAESNCYQRQLTKALRDEGAETWSLTKLFTLLQFGRPRPIVCCLKQRTLHRYLDPLRAMIKDSPIVIYDQDPWHAYMDDSEYKGIYERVAQTLNVKAFAVTTPRWAQYIASKGLPSMFTPMWILPEYCEHAPAFVNRPITLGFIGSLHPYRLALFDHLAGLGCPVNVTGGNSRPHREYLDHLSKIQVFIHNEDSLWTCDGQPMNLCDTMWIKDVEAAARGCFTLRNRGSGADDYYREIETAFMFDNVDEIPGILDHIRKMPVDERQSLINRTVTFIQKADRWHETAKKLIEAVSYSSVSNSTGSDQ